MEKQTKKTITLQGCKKEIIDTTKRKLLIDGIFAAFLIIVFALVCYILIGARESIPFRVIALTVICAVALAFFGYKVVRRIITLKNLKHGRLSIVTDSVCRVEKIRMGRVNAKAQYEYSVHFSKYGRYSVSEFVYDITSEGDKFYIVVIKGDKKIAGAYHSLMYELKD